MSGRARGGAVVVRAAHGKRRVGLASLPFVDARAIARTLNVSAAEDWDDYRGRGPYALPSDPEAVWAREWLGWDDWLGCMLPFDAARQLASELGLGSEEEYLATMREAQEMDRVDPSAWNAKHALTPRPRESAAPDLARLPLRPDVYFAREWKGWEHFLGRHDDEV
eukprot:425334-Pyramimonas_sp.AAC.2